VAEEEAVGSLGNITKIRSWHPIFIRNIAFSMFKIAKIYLLNGSLMFPHFLQQMIHEHSLQNLLSLPNKSENHYR